MKASELVRKNAPQILEEIKKARNILLHCHPAPDPDSTGSALAMKFALKQLGKEATVIRGDSEVPIGFMHFPGAQEIVQKNFLEVDLSQFDLFISLDSARIEMVSRRGPVVFPKNLRVIAIDHHATNGMFGDINLVDSSYPANCELLYDLFMEWGIEMTEEIASNLFMGIYTDTGAFRYSGVTSCTYEKAGKLAEYISDVPVLINKMVNSNTPEFIAFEAEALKNVEVIHGLLAMSSVPYSVIREKNIPLSEVKTSEVSSFLLTVVGWEIAVSAVEIEPNVVKFSIRSKDGNRYDISKLAASLGGGGHKAASGLILSKPLDEAKKAVADKAKEMYNL